MMSAKFAFTKDALGMALNLDGVGESRNLHLPVEEVREDAEGNVEIVVNTDKHPEFDGKSLVMIACAYKQSDPEGRQELVDLIGEPTTNHEAVVLHFVKVDE